MVDSSSDKALKLKRSLSYPAQSARRARECDGRVRRAACWRTTTRASPKQQSSRLTLYPSTVPRVGDGQELGLQAYKKRRNTKRKAGTQHQGKARSPRGISPKPNLPPPEGRRTTAKGRGPTSPLNTPSSSSLS